MKYPLTAAILLLINVSIFAQLNPSTSPQRIYGHAHNDYAKEKPLITAMENCMASIEADVFLRSGELFVAHETKEITPSRTLANLYLQPLAEAIKSGKIYPMILMIDVKSAADSTLGEIVRQISRFPTFLDSTCPVKFVISGNRPTPQKWSSYPSFIAFDGRPTENYTPEQWARIGLVSDSFWRYNGAGKMPITDKIVAEKLKIVVDSVHAQGKKMRFWATPDTEEAWLALTKVGADYFNTDAPKILRGYIDKQCESCKCPEK